jgi:two-component system response regulator HydG
MIGESAPMRQIIRLIEDTACSKIPVLLLGETGTGKEIAAALIHDCSGRRGRFVAVNCAALNLSLIEDELFGHEKGSFTGADRRHEGLFEQANNGTLFLDEITEMPIEAQAKLLRVLEQARVRRVGGKEETVTDVRFIAASNRPVGRSSREGNLRLDLFYRLDGLRIELPPLRERLEDLPLLIQHFLRQSNQENNRQVEGVDDECLDAMHAYWWPGNIRELKHTIDVAVVLCKTGKLSIHHLPARIVSGAKAETSFTVHLPCSAHEVLQELVTRTIKYVGGNKERAAELLGLSRATVYNWLARYLRKQSGGALNGNANGNDHRDRRDFS